MDGENWRVINLFAFRKPATPIIIQKLSNRASNFLTHLRLRGCLHLTDLSTEIFVNNCGKNLVEINVNRCTGLTDESLSIIAEARTTGKLPKLAVVKAANNANFTDFGLSQLLEFPLRVVDFSWTNASKLTVNGLAQTHMDGVKQIKLAGCININDENLYSRV